MKLEHIGRQLVEARLAWATELIIIFIFNLFSKPERFALDVEIKATGKIKSESGLA